MVAKSYQKYSQIGEPYTNSNGRTYIKIDTGKAIKEVRWYTEREYYAIYKDEIPTRSTQKEALGFARGFITIFKGDTNSKQKELVKAGARYARYWGWYIVSTLPTPSIEGLEPIILPWDTVGDSSGKCMPEAAILATVKKLLS